MIPDRKRKPYSEQELRIVGKKPSPFPTRPASNIYNTPISYRENTIALFQDKAPCFAVNHNDLAGVSCGFYQNYLARGNRAEPRKKDAFGVEWIFEPTVGGSISVSGQPRFEDVNDWKDAISMPDVDSWDWEQDAIDHKADPSFAMEMTFVNGFWFERLISLMDFVNAAMALVDDEQEDAIHELFEATTDLACRIVDKACQYWPGVDIITLHDDWGSQREPFFSDRIARELFLPHMKHLVDHIHSKGRFCALHSCGNVASRVPVFIDAGIDSWQLQANANNVHKVYEELGDKIILQVGAPAFDLKDDEAAVQAARKYVDTYCLKGKPTMLLGKEAMASPAFCDELYSYSRKHYLNF